MTTDPGDLVLDPTCGSGTTAYVAEQWGRRWITIDTSRVALALARTRLMAAKYPYYLMADTPEGQRREAELTGAPPHRLDRGRHPQGLRLRARAARDPEVDRPEPRDPRGDDPRRDRRRDRPQRRHGDPVRPPVRRPEGRPGRRAVHRREPVAPPRRRRRPRGPRQPAGAGRGLRPLRRDDPRQPPLVGRRQPGQGRAPPLRDARPVPRAASSRPPARSARARPIGASPSRSGRSTGPSGRTSSARPPSRPAATSTSWSCAASPSTPAPTRRPARRCASAS